MPRQAEPAVAERLAGLCEALVGAYPTAGWWPARSRFEVMVGAVLVQNTRWTNVAPAIARLRAAGLLIPQSLAAVPADRLALLISPAGCQRVKAARLRHLAAGVLAAGGLRHLARRSTPSLRDVLLAWHGVGEETADAILLHAFARPVFIADAYARRWLDRTGVHGAGTGPGAYSACKIFVEGQLNWPEATRWQALHAAIVLHAQQRCRTEPRCSDCPVESICLFKKQIVII